MSGLCAATWSKRYVVTALGRASNGVYHMNRALELARRLRKRGHRAAVVFLRPQR